MYEYRCGSCGDQIVHNERLEDTAPLEAWFHDEDGPWGPGSTVDGDCGPLKRTWSVGFQIKSTDWGH